MINIASLILTRRCNLKCEYCRISGDADYIIAPSEYPNASYYYENEQLPVFWENVIKNLIRHNKDMFFILFGGEPFLYNGLVDIVKYMNSENIYYTIISNCSVSLRKEMNKFFEEVGKVKGFTASIDPGYWIGVDSQEQLKSNMGFQYLKSIINKGLIEDPVAEITVDNDNIIHLEETVMRLSDEGITSDITVLDIAKNNYYDFSAITITDQLVTKSSYTKKVFDSLINSDYKIHMKEILLPKIYEILPADLDCKLEEGLHNITIDSDGSLRTCLRIRGREVPKFNVQNLLDPYGNYKGIMNAYKQDKETLCKGCSWSCPIISKMNIERIQNH